MSAKIHSTTDPALVRIVICSVAALYIGIMILLPLVVVFVQAFAKGIGPYFAALLHEDAQAAIRLTLLVTAIAVPCNVVFGLAASWAITKFEFTGKRFLITLIDLPFSISPVISGLVFVLLFGTESILSGWLTKHNIHILFAVPGLVIATIFVTFPFVARELIPLMEEQGTEAEEAAIMLGANGWQTFWHITLPNIRWGLLYGVLLCTARAMGEFGAVSVVSGHISGVTTTIPLHVESLYNEYNSVAAFAVASILTLFALFTMLIKHIVEYYSPDEVRSEDV
jgi:sulfate/thiosulfate transport system permease protein